MKLLDKIVRYKTILSYCLKCQKKRKKKKGSKPKHFGNY